MGKKVIKYSGRKLKKPNMKQVGSFTQIPNAFILNPNIGNPELRLLLYIMMYSENRRITTKNCMKHLKRTMPSITGSFEKLIVLGIMKITDETIEIQIPEEMKKYTLAYNPDEESPTPDVKKTISSNKEDLPSDIKKTLPLESNDGYDGYKENYSTDVKNTLPSDKENFTSDVKKINKKPLLNIDNVSVTDTIILNNTTRVLPVPAKSGNTEQTHSNGNTKGNDGDEWDLECVELQSLASPSVLAPSLHTPKQEIENGDDVLSFPNKTARSEVFSKSPVVTTSHPIKTDIRFAEQLEIYNTSNYFLTENLNKVKALYNDYADQYPNAFLPIMKFEEVLVYLMTVTLGMVKMRGINYCLLYRNDIGYHFKDIQQFQVEMDNYPTETSEILKKHRLKM